MKAPSYFSATGISVQKKLKSQARNRAKSSRRKTKNTSESASPQPTITSPHPNHPYSLRQRVSASHAEEDDSMDVDIGHTSITDDIDMEEVDSDCGDSENDMIVVNPSGEEVCQRMYEIQAIVDYQIAEVRFFFSVYLPNLADISCQDENVYFDVLFVGYPAVETIPAWQMDAGPKLKSYCKTHSIGKCTLYNVFFHF